MQASYLFQKDKNYDMTFDTGDKAIQCGRHNDVFKLWLMWRAKVYILTSDIMTYLSYGLCGVPMYILWRHNDVFKLWQCGVPR